MQVLNDARLCGRVHEQFDIEEAEIGVHDNEPRTEFDDLMIAQVFHGLASRKLAPQVPFSPVYLGVEGGPLCSMTLGGDDLSSERRVTGLIPTNASV